MKMRNCLAVAVVVLALIFPLYCQAAAGDSRSESCRKFVQEFYNWYLKRCENGEGVSDAIKTRNSAFSPSIIRGIKEDAAVAAKHPNEIVGLDFDPVLNGQDFAKKYEVGKVSKKGDRYLVDVYGIWDKKKDEIPGVTPELAWVNGHWRFENFHYRREGKNEKDDDLLHVLLTLKRERQRLPK